MINNRRRRYNITFVCFAGRQRRTDAYDRGPIAGDRRTRQSRASGGGVEAGTDLGDRSDHGFRDRHGQLNGDLHDDIIMAVYRHALCRVPREVVCRRTSLNATINSNTSAHNINALFFIIVHLT